MPLKIVHVFGHGWGGAFVINQVLGLRALGHLVYVVAPEEGPFVERLRAENVPVAIIPFGGSRARDVPRIVRAVWELRRHLGSIKPDVLHLHLIKAMIVGRLAAIRSEIPVVVSELGGPLPLEIWSLRWLDLGTAWVDDRIIASSRVIERIYRRYRHTRSKVETVYYGFDTRKFIEASGGEAFRAEFQIPTGAVVVGMVAHMYDNSQRRFREVGLKGHEVFLDAAARVAAARSDVHFLVVGDDVPSGAGYRQRLEERARRLGIREICTFAGHREDVTSALAAMNIVAVPSLSENLGGAVEPLLAGRPVVASDVGGLPEVVFDGVSGKLVPPRDAVALADAMIDLLSLSEAAIREMGLRGQAIVHERFDLETTVRSVERIYISALRHETDANGRR